MRQPSNLPPGVTDRMIEDQQEDGPPDRPESHALREPRDFPMDARTGCSRCTRCGQPVDTPTYLYLDLLCPWCANLGPREFYNLRSHDAVQEDAINDDEKKYLRRRHGSPSISDLNGR